MAASALIINADDLGLSPAVSDGIFSAWAQGAISDATVFANAPDLADMLARARDERLPVGVHLNLTYGEPLSHPAEVSELVGSDGRFMRREQWARPLPMMDVRLELRRQLLRVLELGGRPSHLDSHHHVHRYPEVLAVVISLAQEFNLPVRAVDDAMRLRFRLAGIPTPDAFTIAFYGENATVETLMAAAESCDGGVLEIMTHPGSADGYIPGSYTEGRARELAALTDPRWRDWLAQHHLPRQSFTDLCQL